MHHSVHCDCSGATTPSTESQLSSVPKLESADDRSQPATLLDVRKEPEAAQMSLGDDTVGVLSLMQIQLLLMWLVSWA